MMAGKNKGKGRASRGREQAASAIVIRVRGARGRGRSSCVAGIQEFTTDDLMDWMTRPSSSSSSSAVTQRQSNSSTAATLASSATPAIAPPTCVEESAELFQHSVGELVLEQDAQHLLGSQEEQKMSQLESIGSDVVPTAAAYCQIDSGNEEDDDEVLDRTWVPGRNDEGEEEIESQPRAARGGSQRDGSRKSTIPPSVQTGPAQVNPSRPVIYGSEVWAFFTKSTADPTIAICRVCLQKVKRGMNVAHLGTTCMRHHLAKQRAGQYNRGPPSDGECGRVPLPIPRASKIFWKLAGTGGGGQSAGQCNRGPPLEGECWYAPFSIPGQAEKVGGNGCQREEKGALPLSIQPCALAPVAPIASVNMGVKERRSDVMLAGTCNNEKVNGKVNGKRGFCRFLINQFVNMAEQLNFTGSLGGPTHTPTHTPRNAF